MYLYLSVSVSVSVKSENQNKAIQQARLYLVLSNFTNGLRDRDVDKYTHIELMS